MTQQQFPQHQPDQPDQPSEPWWAGSVPPDLPTQPPTPGHTKPRRWPWIVAIPVALLAGIGIGNASAGEGEPIAAVAAPAATVEVEVPGPTKTVKVEVPGPARTVEVPVAGPTVTVVAKAPAPAPAPKKAAPAPVTSFPGDGTFVVGEDVKPGRYKSKASDGGMCYWARLKDLDGDLDSIIANNLSEGASVVTIKKADEAFETNGCQDWVRVD